MKNNKIINKIVKVLDNIISKIKNLNKKTKYIIIGLLLILILLYIIVPKSLDTILTRSGFKLTDKISKGTEDEILSFNRNTYEYQNGEISIIVYEYDSLAEIKEEILEQYNTEKGNNEIAFETELKDEKNYIYKKSCDDSTCFYKLGYEAELATTIVNTNLEKNVDKIFTKIIKKMRLK